MPANLPPEYIEAEKRYRAAKEPEEKIEALHAMLAVMPRHKGTDRLHGELRRKIAKLSQEAERKTATARRAGFYIRKEGAGQVVFVGPSNTGKSQLLNALTGAEPEVAPYPFTTQTPALGMMGFEDIQIQLVDTPPIEHKAIRPMLSNTLRTTDLIAIVVDLSANPVGQVEIALQSLLDIRIVSYGSDEVEPGISERRMLIVANKSDLAQPRALIEHYGDRLEIVPVSALTGEGLDKLKTELFHSLDICRVYTKARGAKADRTEPVVLKKGSTVHDVAEAIHKDFAAHLKYAVIWGSGKFDAQKASKTHVLQDGDIVEFHA